MLFKEELTISFIVLSWNKPEVLKQCLHSLLNQNLGKYEVIIVDSASTENNIEIIKFFKKKSHKIKLISLSKNVGLSKAYNIGISQANGKYLFIMNHDFLVEKASVSKLLKFLVANDQAGAVMGKIKRYNFNQNIQTNIIDSCGIKMFPNRRFKDIGEGQYDTGQFDGTDEVFGVSGAGSLYKKEALESIRFKNEYFDEDFFMYKDDIDLSWRLRWEGWKLFYLSDAIFWHGRSSGGVNDNIKGKLARFQKIIKNEREKPFYIRKLSYRNHLLLLIKNDDISSFKKNLFSIFNRQLLVFIFNLIISPKIVTSLFDVIKLFKNYQEKRRKSVKINNINNVYKFLENRYNKFS